MINNISLKKLLLAPLIGIIFFLLAMTSSAGGPEPSKEPMFKKGKMKGIVEIELREIDFGEEYCDGYASCVDIYFTGKCQKNDQGESNKYEDYLVCEACWGIDTDSFELAQTPERIENELMEKEILGYLPDCFSPDNLVNPDLELVKITDIAWIANEDGKISAKVTIRALE
jgi:hypothetical protein